MSGSPRLSVITATRNRPQHLRRALASVCAQTFADLEMVVVDDGSEAKWRDEYDQVVADADARLRFSRVREAGAPRSGPGAARNRALERARGEFVAFLDDDDLWVDRRHLEVATAALDAAGAEFYFANMQGVRAGAVVIEDYLPDTPELLRGPLVLREPAVYDVGLRAFVEAMQHHLVHPDMMVVRRTLVDRIAGGFNEKIRYAEDYEWMMRLGDLSRGTLYRPEVVAHIRLPEADSSSNWESELDHALDNITAAQQVRAKCRTAAVRRCARAREAWSMRELAAILDRTDSRSAALSFAWGAVCVYPTLGGVVNVARLASATRRSSSKATSAEMP